MLGEPGGRNPHAGHAKVPTGRATGTASEEVIAVEIGAGQEPFLPVEHVMLARLRREGGRGV
jgi:hypothetical protein